MKRGFIRSAFCILQSEFCIGFDPGLGRTSDAGFCWGIAGVGTLLG